MGTTGWRNLDFGIYRAPVSPISQEPAPVLSSPPPTDLSTFLSFPSPEKLLRLGPKVSMLIVQQVRALPAPGPPHTTGSLLPPLRSVSDLLGLSQDPCHGPAGSGVREFESFQAYLAVSRTIPLSRTFMQLRCQSASCNSLIQGGAAPYHCTSPCLLKRRPHMSSEL